MQLEVLPAHIDENIDEAMRLLVPGPGSWVTRPDLHNLSKIYGMPVHLNDIHATALAAKLRVIHTLAKDCHARKRELDQVHADHFQRPHGGWHYRSLFGVLCEAEDRLNHHGIGRRLVQRSLPPGLSFQRKAYLMIHSALSKPYFAESRIRAKLYRWKLNGIPAHTERNILKNFQMLREMCHPRVTLAYFRLIWNGWVTDRRMNVLVPATSRRGCVFGCGWDEDSIEHYSLCRVFWDFAASPRPTGLGIDTGMRSRDAFFMVHSNMTRDDRIRMAIGGYAAYRAVCHLRHSDPNDSCRVPALLSLFAKAAAAGSKAHGLLRYA